MSDPAPASEALRSWANLPCGDVDDMEPIGLGGETRLMTREEVLGAPDAADATADAEDSPESSRPLPRRKARRLERSMAWERK